jgi:hypothetical protein
VRIGVDGERAAGLYGQPEQALGRVEPVRATVDLDGLAVCGAGREHRFGVEVALFSGRSRAVRPVAAARGQLATGAVAEDVQVRVGDRGEHPLGHHRALVTQPAV